MKLFFLKKKKTIDEIFKFSKNEYIKIPQISFLFEYKKEKKNKNKE
jgi:hypothetical protein